MRCKVCRVSFKPVYFLQKTCSKECEKEYKVENRKQPKVKVISDKEKLQVLINQLIRKIDYGAVCISSGKFSNQIDAGHYYPISAHPELRYNLCNIYGQSREDNCYKHSNRTGYQQGLINQFGQDWADYVFGLPLSVKLGSRGIYTQPDSTSTKSYIPWKEYINTVQNIIQQYDSTRTNSAAERIRQRLEFNHRIFGYSIPEGFSI